MGIRDKRVNYKPFEYPEVMTFVDAINQTYWVHSEVDFTADVQDYNTTLSDKDKEMVKRSLLGISQTEIGVKTFWGNLYNHFQKPEMNGLGVTLAENEFRHSEAYSRLTTVLGIEDEFNDLINVPVIKDRIKLSETYLRPDANIIFKLLYFTIIIENATLFSLFANVLSLTRFKGKLKNVSNIIAWTSADEDIHANAGIYLLNELNKEGQISDEDKIAIRKAAQVFINFEIDFLDWIYEHGEPDNFKKKDMINFMKHRVDSAFDKLNIKRVFNVSSEEYMPMKWFDEEIYSNSLDDFFAKRPVDYTKHDKSITSNDLF